MIPDMSRKKFCSNKLALNKMIETTVTKFEPV